MRGMKKNKGERPAAANPKRNISHSSEQPAVDSPKRNAPQSREQPTGSGKKSKRAAASTDYEERSVHISEESVLMEIKVEPIVYEEGVALQLTCRQHEDRPRRRLADFIFNDSDGQLQCIEMSKIDDLLISGLILPLENSSDKQDQKCVRCVGFGPIESWSISGYQVGSPAVSVSTDAADYDCTEPAGSYKKVYDQFFEKAHACVEVYRKLSKSCDGNPGLSLDELLASVDQTMSARKWFPRSGSIRDFIISQGEFIHRELGSLNRTSNQSDETLSELAVLVALRDECYKRRELTKAKAASPCDTYMNDAVNDSDHSSIYSSQEYNDLKLARFLQEEEYSKSIMHNHQIQGSAPFRHNRCYIIMNEDEIANDYPLPAYYYKTSNKETDEFLFFDNDVYISDTDELPESILENWSLYNSDLRLISLELLPMEPCADIDVTVYGSGVMTQDIGGDSSSSNQDPGDLDDGTPIYLSAIREWTIDFGSSNILISIRTDVAWYKLGKPSKQYIPWYEPVMKTAMVAISIVALLNEQGCIATLTLADTIERISNFQKDHPAYISSDPADVERYVVVHGQIILQQFAELQDGTTNWSAFVNPLVEKMQERRHTKLAIKMNKTAHESKPNLNPSAALAPVTSKRKIMKATTTKMIDRIWGEYYSNYLPAEDLNEDEVEEQEQNEEDDEQEEEEEEEEEEKILASGKTQRPSDTKPGRSKLLSTSKEIWWDGEFVGRTSSGNTLYNHAIVGGEKICVGDAVLVEVDESDELPVIYLVEYMFESLDGRKLFHGRMLQHGSQTVLGDTANARELFLTNNCLDLELQEIKQMVVVNTRKLDGGHEHRKENAEFERIEERRREGLPIGYYCKSLYWPERGAFFSLPLDTMGIGTGFCHSCEIKESQKTKDTVIVNYYKTSYAYKGTEYSIDDFVYVDPQHFAAAANKIDIGRHKGLKTFVVCQVMDLFFPRKSRTIGGVKLRRFFRPEDLSGEMVYTSDIREVYYSEETDYAPVEMIKGKCEVVKKRDLPSSDVPAIVEHIFFCERQFDRSNGSLKLLAANIKLRYSDCKNALDDAAIRRRKGKAKVEGDERRCKTASQENCLTTLDIFAGCGGLSEGLQQSGVSVTKWAIEDEEPAGHAFQLNHPESFMFINNCNVILRAIMDKGGDEDDCVSTSKTDELAESLSKKEVNNLPMPGQVDFISGGPPCQAQNHGTCWSKVQCEMILTFLSFADYFRPRFFLLHNPRNFLYLNKGKTFHLTLASLLEMGYQVRFGILEDGAYGVSQSQKRVYIWAASAEETLPEWPEPMHVFPVPELRITLSENMRYAAVRSPATGAPFQGITVEDTIADLPAIRNGAFITDLEYKFNPVSWFQKKIRGNMEILRDHISKEMNELNFIRCHQIPRGLGADWLCLPDEKITLSNGEEVDLMPWHLPNSAKGHNQWKGLFGRLEWFGYFPTIIDPQPMGKVGMCFHPMQSRIVSVRECARSRGFPDSYKFSGYIQQKHRQIGKAVSPPLAFALGRKLKEALENKRPV